MTKSRAFLAAIVTLISIVGCSAVPFAVKAITLIPPSAEFSDVVPGATVPSKLKLYNESASTVTVYPETANFTALDETGTPNIIFDDVDEGLETWITVEPGPFTIEPGQRLEVPFSINVPEDAAPGGHYAAIMFSPQEPVAVQQGQVAIGQKIGTLVLLRVAGTLNESGQIAQFSTIDGDIVGKTRYSRLPVEFEVRFQNRGNVHLRPNGSVVIRNMLGGTAAVLQVNNGLAAVLPNSIRKFEAAWEKQTNIGTGGNFFTEISREWSNFAFGPYTADLTLTYGANNDKIVQQTLQFWVFPWRVLLLALIVLIVAVLAIVFGVKRYNAWIVSRATSRSEKK